MPPPTPLPPFDRPRAELETLTRLGLCSVEELEDAIATAFNPGRCAFHRSRWGGGGGGGGGLAGNSPLKSGICPPGPERLVVAAPPLF